MRELGADPVLTAFLIANRLQQRGDRAALGDRLCETRQSRLGMRAPCAYWVVWQISLFDAVLGLLRNHPDCLEPRLY